MPDYPQEAQPQNLPFQVEAEQAFLGCLLLDPSTISVALEEISGRICSICPSTRSSTGFF